MKELEKVNAMLKQFMEESLAKANKLDEEIKAMKLERDAKYKEIEDVLAQMDYLDMIKLQLEEKLELLEMERAKIDEEISERELEVRKNDVEGVVDKTNDGEEMLEEEKDELEEEGK